MQLGARAAQLGARVGTRGSAPPVASVALAVAQQGPVGLALAAQGPQVPLVLLVLLVLRVPLQVPLQVPRVVQQVRQRVLAAAVVLRGQRLNV